MAGYLGSSLPGPTLLYSKMLKQLYFTFFSRRCFSLIISSNECFTMSNRDITIIIYEQVFLLFFNLNILMAANNF